MNNSMMTYCELCRRKPVTSKKRRQMPPSRLCSRNNLIQHPELQADEVAHNNDQVVYIPVTLVILCLRRFEKLRMPEASFRPNPPRLHPLHFIKAGFTDVVDEQLVREAEIGKVAEWQKYVVIRLQFPYAAFRCCDFWQHTFPSCVGSSQAIGGTWVQSPCSCC